MLRYPRIVKRHKQDETAIQRFLKLLENEAIIVENQTEVLDVVKEDQSDNRYLECAVEGKAQFVSGDNVLHFVNTGVSSFCRQLHLLRRWPEGKCSYV